jgi:NAD(P)-dependent dehydrogenase (short-subunit alcohol dehydrogenase family)
MDDRGCRDRRRPDRGALPRLPACPPAVVSLTSSVANQGRIDFADLSSERRYRFTGAYSASKLATLMFALELDRRAKEAARVRLMSIAVNPGIVATGLLRSKREQWGSRPGAGELAVAAAQRLFGQPPVKAA